MPSPAITTVRPTSCRPRTVSAFSPGRTPATISSISSSCATAAAVVTLSPVSITMRRPSARSARIAAGALFLIGSATAIRPASSSPTATRITVSPRRRLASAASPRESSAIPSSVRNSGVPAATARPSITPLTPFPGCASKSARSARSTPRSAASPRIAAATGCSLPFSRLALSRRSSASRQSSPHRRATTAGLPSVRVPVLSITRVSTACSRSIASALLNRTPTLAARPIATMIDIGVASPRAHGQAMIRTATELTSACAIRGSGPAKAQTTKVATAAAKTRGTK